MSRLPTHARKMHPVSRASWKVVTGETLIDTNKGQQPATILIYTWFREWMRTTLGMPITWSGTPLQPGFEWISRAYFNGRPMSDVAEEFEGEALEGAGRGVETHDDTKGPLIPWMKRIMLQHLNDELERWADTSSSVNTSREEHLSIQGFQDAEVTGAAHARGGGWTFTGGGAKDTTAIDAALIAPDPANVIEVDTIDREMCDIALSALSAMESEVLQRFAEGESYHSIARHLGLSQHIQARRIVERARRKAQEALL